MTKLGTKATSRLPHDGKVTEPGLEGVHFRRRRVKSGPAHLSTADPGLSGSGEVSTTVGLGFKELFLKIMRLGGIPPAEGLRRGMWLIMAETVRNVRATIAMLKEVEAREAVERQ